jgi:hypothetical protein
MFGRAWSALQLELEHVLAIGRQRSPLEALLDFEARANVADTASTRIEVHEGALLQRVGLGPQLIGGRVKRLSR